MSVFKIGGTPFRPAADVSNVKKTERKPDEAGSAASKGGLDSVSLRANRLAVMPRMSAVSGQSTQHLRGETVEAMLKDSAKELDDYFAEAYGFKK